jgi:hypothetical protein
MLQTAFIELYGAGLAGLWDSLLANWIGPLFIAAVAVFALVFIKDRAWMKLISFVGIAAVVGVLVFAGGELFGDNKGLQKVAKDQAKQINVVSGPVSAGLK